MAADNEVIIEVIARLDKAEASLKKFEGNAKSSGEKAGEAFGDGFQKAGASFLKKLTAAFLVKKAIDTLIGTFNAALTAAIEQENAINDLNRALASTGQYSKAASQDLLDFSTELQKNSVFGDEAILTNAALIQSLGKLSTDGLKQATQAAADLAATLNIDLHTASQLIGKAAAGNIGTFSRYGIVIKEGATNAETFANTLNALASQQGAAASKLNTFGGAMQAASNAFGDLLEEFGNMIIKSPKIVAALKFISAQITGLAEDSAKMSKSDPLGGLLEAAVALGRILNLAIVGPAELLIRTIGLAINGLSQIAQFGIMLIAKTSGLAFEFIGLFTDKFKQAEEAAKAMALSTGDVFKQIQADGLSQTKGLFGFSGTRAGEAFLSGLGDALADASSITDKVKNGAAVVAEAAKGAFELFVEGNKVFIAENAAAFGEYVGIIGTFSQAQAAAITNFTLSEADKMTAGLEAAKKKFEEFKNFGVQTTQDFARGIAGNFAKVGQTLVRGGGLFSSFGKGILDILGDMAIKVGINIAMQSKALMALAAAFTNPFLAAGSLGAGLALIVLGGALKALAGGGGGGGGDLGGSATSSPVGSSVSSLQEPQRPDPTTGVTVNVQGNVFDNRETGLAIAQVINESFATGGLVLAGGAVV